MVLRRPKYVPIRSCVVCRTTSDKRKLLRVVRLPEKLGGAVVADEDGKMSGRGAYVCATEKCISLAQKQKRFERALTVSAGIIDPELFVKLSRMVAVEAEPSTEVVHETNSESDVLI